MSSDIITVFLHCKASKPGPPKPKPNRARRDCPICDKNVARLPNHLRDTHRLRSKEEREEYLQVAKAKTPDLRLLSKFSLVVVNIF